MSCAESDHGSSKPFAGANLHNLLQIRLRNRQSLEDLVHEMFRERDAKNIVRQAKKGAPLDKDVERALATHAQLSTFSDQLFGWEREFSRLRGLVLTDLPSRVKIHLSDIKADLRAATDASHKGKLLYCQQLGEFRLATEWDDKDHLKAAIKAVQELKEQCRLAGASLSRLFGCIADVNAPAFEWHEMASDKDIDIERLMRICAAGRKACLAGAAAHNHWLGAWRDAAEYTAMLIAYGRQEPQTLEVIVRDITKLFVNQPANYVVRLLQDRMEPKALDVICQSEAFQGLQQLTENDASGRIARIDRSYLAH